MRCKTIYSSHRYRLSILWRQKYPALFSKNEQATKKRYYKKNDSKNSKNSFHDVLEIEINKRIPRSCIEDSYRQHYQSDIYTKKANIKRFNLSLTVIK